MRPPAPAPLTCHPDGDPHTVAFHPRRLPGAITPTGTGRARTALTGPTTAALITPAAGGGQDKTSATAVARPMPRAAPVTTATRPARFPAAQLAASSRVSLGAVSRIFADLSHSSRGSWTRFTTTRGVAPEETATGGAANGYRRAVKRMSRLRR